MVANTKYYYADPTQAKKNVPVVPTLADIQRDIIYSQQVLNQKTISCQEFFPESADVIVDWYSAAKKLSEKLGVNFDDNMTPSDWLKSVVVEPEGKSAEETRNEVVNIAKNRKKGMLTEEDKIEDDNSLNSDVKEA